MLAFDSQTLAEDQKSKLEVGNKKKKGANQPSKERP